MIGNKVKKSFIEKKLIVFLKKYFYGFEMNNLIFGECSGE